LSFDFLFSSETANATQHYFKDQTIKQYKRSKETVTPGVTLSVSLSKLSVDTEAQLAGVLYNPDADAPVQVTHLLAGWYYYVQQLGPESPDSER